MRQYLDIPVDVECVQNDANDAEHHFVVEVYHRPDRQPRILQAHEPHGHNGQDTTQAKQNDHHDGVNVVQNRVFHVECKQDPT